MYGSGHSKSGGKKAPAAPMKGKKAAAPPMPAKSGKAMKMPPMRPKKG